MQFTSRTPPTKRLKIRGDATRTMIHVCHSLFTTTARYLNCRFWSSPARVPAGLDRLRRAVASVVQSRSRRGGGIPAAAVHRPGTNRSHTDPGRRDVITASGGAQNGRLRLGCVTARLGPATADWHGRVARKYGRSMASYRHRRAAVVVVVAAVPP